MFVKKMVHVSQFISCSNALEIVGLGTVGTYNVLRKGNTLGGSNFRQKIPICACDFLDCWSKKLIVLLFFSRPSFDFLKSVKFQDFVMIRQRFIVV